MCPIVSETFNKVSLLIQKKRLSSKFRMPIVKISSLQSYLTFPPSSLSQVSGPAAVALDPPGASGQRLGAHVAIPA